MLVKTATKSLLSLAALLSLTACPPPDDGGPGRLSDGASHPAAALPGSGGVDVAAGLPEVGVGACRIRRFTSSEVITRLAYDSAGQLVSVTKRFAGRTPHQVTTYERDSNGRVVERSLQASSTDPWVTTFERMADGLVAFARQRGNLTADWSYTYTDGKLTRIKHVEDGETFSTWRLEYTAEGRLSRKTIGYSTGDLVADYTYDEAGHLSRKLITRGDRQSEEKFSWIDGKLKHIDYPETDERTTYHYDLDGLLVSMVRTVEDKQIEEVLYDYDCSDLVDD